MTAFVISLVFFKLLCVVVSVYSMLMLLFEATCASFGKRVESDSVAFFTVFLIAALFAWGCASL